METAISGIVVAGITASLLLAVRYSQMVSEGKAVGQQMMTISEGANRYMKQYSQEILRLDARCAESTLQIDEGNNRPSTPPGTGPDCRLVLGSITVANGFQPTVKELQDLELVRANDGLLLPFSPGITVDRRTGEAALARIAVAIRPVRHQQATEGPATGSEATGGDTAAGGVIPAGFVPGINHSLGGPIISFKDFEYKVGTDADRDLPPTINGVSCYAGTVDFRVPTIQLTDRVFVDAKNDLKVLPIYTLDDAIAATSPGGVYYRGDALSFSAGRMYCRYLQQKYGMGLIASAGTGSGVPGSGSGGSGSGSAWTLESVVFNTQPYYFGSADLPLGAAAQMGAALQEAGYAGRMSMLKSSMVESRTLRGLFGHSQSENPIQSKDGARGLPGILAAVSLLADSAQADAGAATTRPSWDAAGNNITNAGLIHSQQLSSNTAVIGTQTALPAEGRDAVLAVNGDLVMGTGSKLLAANLTATEMKTGVAKARSVEIGGLLQTPGMQQAGAGTRVGHVTNQPYNFYLRNGTNIRLPRVEIGKPCATYGDIGVSKGLSIQRPGGQLYEVARFIALCKPDFIRNSTIPLNGTDSTATFRTSTWSSSEYDALQLKYPPHQYDWVWFESSYADRTDHEPGL